MPWQAALWFLPVHRGGWGAQTVIDKPHVALVQLQRQGVVVSLVEKDAIVLVRGHLERGMWVRAPLRPGLPTPPSQRPLTEGIFWMNPRSESTFPFPPLSSLGVSQSPDTYPPASADGAIQFSNYLLRTHYVPLYLCTGTLDYYV